WLYTLLFQYVENHELGLVLGSRTAVRITGYDGRLPDLLFVRKDRLGILESLKLSEPPDLVIEIISPGDRRSDRMELEADYRSIGVPEIVFIDVPRHRVQVLRRADADYRVDEVMDGVLTFESVPGFWVEVDWLLTEARIPVHEALSRIGAAGR